MKESEAKPSLRLSHIVYGRETRGNRVFYLVDPKGQGTLRAVPESVVLRRWRQRQFTGYRFSGTRLSSTLWRAVDFALGRDSQAICSMTVEELARTIDRQRQALKSRFLALPSPDALHALFSVCGPHRVEKILKKHLSSEHAGLSGVPDLFLYAVEGTSSHPTIARFVEVKKPEEPASRVQLEEIDFLNKQGLNARVLRLIERDLSRTDGA